MHQPLCSCFLPCCLKPLIQILTDLPMLYFNFASLSSINQEHQSMVFDCLLDFPLRFPTNFYSFIKEFFDQQLQPYLLKLLQDQQIFLFLCLKLIVFILEQFCLNFIEAVAAIVKELMQSYLDLISCIIHKWQEEALFHNQVISQALINYFAKKTQQAFHNFSKFHLHRELYTKPYYKVWDVKRMDHTYHFLLLDKFSTYIPFFGSQESFL